MTYYHLNIERGHDDANSKRLFVCLWMSLRRYSRIIMLVFALSFGWAAVIGLSEGQVVAESPYEAAVARLMARTLSDPQLKDALLARLRANCNKRRCKDEDTRLGLELAKSGIQRLDSSTLTERAKLLAVILKSVDDRSCAALSRGDITEWRAALDKLAPTLLDSWMVLGSKALVAELKQVPRRKLTDRELQQAETHFRSHLTDQERRRVARLPKNDAPLSDADLCWITRLAYEKLPMLSEPHRSVWAVHLAQD